MTHKELNELHFGDCMRVMPYLADKSADLILCDLPYGITDCEWDKALPVAELWEQYNRIIKDDGAIVLTAVAKFAVELINANRKYFRYDLVWEKSMSVGFANAKRMPLRKHENILVFYKKLPTYNPQGLVRLDKPKTGIKRGSNSVYRDDSLNREYVSYYTNYPVSVLKFNNPNNANVHPTQKPLALFEYLIRTYTNEGDTVLDNCAGSGTMAVAAKNTGRRFIAIERDETYYRVAKRRLSELDNICCEIEGPASVSTVWAGTK